MKILGYTYFDEQLHFTMKCDASLLNQGKPFFIPTWSNDFRYVPCTVVRISRLGKGIEPRFANRYYDAVADGLDLLAYDLLHTQYAQATAFDGSLCVGEWQSTDMAQHMEQQIAQAIHDASQMVTLRMGDLLYIDQPKEPEAIHLEQIFDQPHLFCKIK